MTASMLLMSALMLVSCEKTGGDDTSMDAGFFVTLDKNVIQSNGEDEVNLKATLDGKDVTAEAIFYLVSGKNLTPMTSNIFTTDKVGTYSFRASYLTFSTEEPVDLEVVLPESLKKELEPFVTNELAKVLKGGVEASFSKKIAGGFTIGPKDGGYFISFTDETFNALIAEYLRPATKKILFG